MGRNGGIEALLVFLMNKSQQCQMLLQMMKNGDFVFHEIRFEARFGMYDLNLSSLVHSSLHP